MGAQPEAAVPGSYGEPPRDYRLPETTRLGMVSLQVADLDRSLAFYQRILELRLLRREPGRATLGRDGDQGALVELHERPGARPMSERGRLGLYHFAILMPDRASLARFVRHLGDMGVNAGTGDHLVSEAFYLRDPDGLGIEVYADRPRGTWRRIGRELMMATDPLDVAGLVAAAGDEVWNGMPAGTVIGHVHLHVGDIARASAFFSEALGFDRMVWSYPGALFVGAGGYHHHLGVNTWAGPGAEPPAEGDARLLAWTIDLPDGPSVVAAAESLGRAGFAVERLPDAPPGTGIETRDPWGTAIHLRVGRGGHGG